VGTEADVDVLDTLGSMDHDAVNSLLSRIFSLTEPPQISSQLLVSSEPSNALSIYSLRSLEVGFQGVTKGGWM